jgi:hypothetical protein
LSKLLVHCGLHKTASTTLQIALAEHSEQLRSAGFLFPVSGRTNQLGGQHNLALQIARDRRFDRARGDIDALFEEIRGFTGDVIISSEDFESSISRPESFLPLLTGARAVGMSVSFIVYLRNQTSYLESLYQEMIKHGFGEEFADFADAALLHGTLRLKEWEFQFNYWNVVRNLMRLPECKLIVRNFEAMLEGSPILDFSTVVGIPHSALPPSLNSPTNVRDPGKVSLTLFYQNRVGRELDRHEVAVIERLFELSPEPIGTTGMLRYQLEQKFAYSNRKVCDHFGIPLTGLVPEDNVPPSVPRRISMQKIFSFETQCIVRDIARLHALGHADAAHARSQQCVAAWRYTGY